MAGLGAPGTYWDFLLASRAECIEGWWSLHYWGLSMLHSTGIALSKRKSAFRMQMSPCQKGTERPSTLPRSSTPTAHRPLSIAITFNHNHRPPPGQWMLSITPFVSVAVSAPCPCASLSSIYSGCPPRADVDPLRAATPNSQEMPSVGADPPPPGS
ncbi:hypothetical protein M011DRAFT_324432 [Sporormia fimetaria CBS 119925]|uniref:Uncharacterized protein n=1 Tax=Sporormia fimetaria CBS 119925 TaxID=1340428 RepID=A0A6A6VIN6_9PLEO|nr:hypothetical protein M011DRAFT_324432 [Sporormia fimetaria CBS 119925]